MTARADLVIVGAGAAGLYACLCAVREGARVVLVSARPLAETASYWAQGGAAAALTVDDSPECHLADTVAAGRGLVRRAAAEVLCAEAPDRVRDLQQLGVRFDADRRERWRPARIVSSRWRAGESSTASAAAAPPCAQ